MKHRTMKASLAVALSLLLATGISSGIGASAEEEATSYGYEQCTGGITANGNYGITYAPFDSVSVETVATANRAEANYGWGAFAAKDFDYSGSIAAEANALVVEIAFPQPDFNYGLQLAAIDKEENKANMHAGYGWNNVMAGNTAKSFFRMHDVTNAAGEAGKIYEVPLRAWIFSGLTVGADGKVVNDVEHVKKSSFYGKFIFPLENYSNVDFTNLDQLIFMSAAANNKSGRFNIGKISLAKLDYNSTVTERPYVIDNTDGTKLTSSTTIWSPSEENALPYIPAALDGVDDGAFRVSYCPVGLNIERDATALKKNDFSLTVPFASSMGVAVPTEGMGFYFTIDNSDGPVIEYMLELTDSENSTNVWRSGTPVADEEAYTKTDVAHYTFPESGTANYYPVDGAAYTGGVGVVPAGFSGKIYVPFSTDNFVAAKEETTFPATVLPTMKVLVNALGLQEGEKVNISIDTANVGWQSASAITPVEPPKDIVDYDMTQYNLAKTNPLDEEATRLHYTKLAKGDCFIELDLTKDGFEEIDAQSTLGFAIVLQNPKTANRPFNIRFYDEDGEIYVPSSGGAGVRLIDGYDSVNIAEIRSSKQIRVAGGSKVTMVIPWSSVNLYKGEETAVNGKLNKIVKITIDVYPDQPAPSELEWIIGDYATISKETGELNAPVSLKTSDWTIGREIEEGITVLDPLSVCNLSYETNMPEGLLVAELSTTKVYYPFGDAFLQVIAEDGYEIVRVTLNGEEIDKQGANTYGVGTITTGGDLKFYVEVKTIEDDSSDSVGGNNSGDDKAKGGCGSSVALGGAVMFALLGGAVLLKKKKD